LGELREIQKKGERGRTRIEIGRNKFLWTAAEARAGGRGKRRGQKGENLGTECIGTGGRMKIANFSGTVLNQKPNVGGEEEVFTSIFRNHPTPDQNHNGALPYL